ncbi:MAG: hypothetical protein E7812_04635 [Phenylobacterium sp.]|nr:MAG: hypothetical protein E7812_04635 [Phenylobacterium sp.]
MPKPPYDSLEPPPTMGDLIAAAWRLARPVAPQLAGVWLVLTAASAVSLQASASVGLGPRPLFSAAQFASTLAQTLALALISAATLRLLLQPGAAWRRVDAGLGAYVAVNVLVALLPQLETVALRAMTSSTVGLARGMSLLSLANTLIYPLAIWVCLRLLLWPIGLLLGEAAAAPGRSWARMRGVVWPSALTFLVLGAPPLLAGTLPLFHYIRLHDLASALLAAPFLAVYAVVANLIPAAVYRLRARGDGGMAAVFD